MKHLLKSATVLSIIAISCKGYADGPSDVTNFTPRIKLQSRYSLSDSYRKNQADLISATARMGMNYRYKNVTGVIEFQAGSPSDGFTNSNLTSGATTANAPTDNGQQSLFVVRRANLGLEVVKSDPATVAVVIGRDHLSGSTTYAPDAINQVLSTNLENVSAATGEDGLSVKYAGKFEFGKVSAVLGYYNNLAVSTNGEGATWFSATPVVVSDNSFNSAPKSQSRAMMGIVTGDISMGDGVIEAKALYGSQPNAVTKVTNSKSYTARDVSNTELSVGYNYNQDAIKGGIWYQSVTQGATQASSGTFSTNDITYINANSNDSATINTFGLGVVGSSKLLGMTGFLADGDALTYAAAYQNATGQRVSGDNNAELTTDFYNVGLGYQQGKFTLELNYAFANANYAIYTDSSGTKNQKSANILYLVGTLSVI